MRKLPDILAEEARAAADDRDLRSRTDERRARRETEEALARLARELCALSDRRLERLGLPEAVLDAVLDARKISSAIARNRQLRIVRSALRDGDAAAIRARLEAFSGGRAPAAAAPPAGSRNDPEWVARLLEGGSDALEAFLREHPGAERTHLRQLVRAVARAPSADRRTKARERLAAALHDAEATAAAVKGASR